MAGGAVSGAILGAIDGGIGGALKGAAWGAGIGGILGAGYAGLNGISEGLGGAFIAGVAVGGAVYAGVSGGLEGLGDYAAGALGSYYGFTLGNALVNPEAYAQTQTEGTGALSDIEKQQIKEQLNAGQIESPTGKSNSSTPSSLEAHEKAKIMSDSAKKGEIGKGNNPDISKDPSSLTQAEIRATARAYYRQKSLLSLIVDKYVILGKAIIKYLWQKVGAAIVAYDAIDAEIRAQTGKSAFTNIKEFLSAPEKYTPDEYGYMFH